MLQWMMEVSFHVRIEEIASRFQDHIDLSAVSGLVELIV